MTVSSTDVLHVFMSRLPIFESLQLKLHQEQAARVLAEHKQESMMAELHSLRVLAKQIAVQMRGHVGHQKQQHMHGVCQRCLPSQRAHRIAPQQSTSRQIMR